MLTPDTGPRLGVNFREVRAARLRPGRLFRCGDVTAWTPSEAAFLREQHGIRTLIDLRTPREIAKYGAPQALLDAGVRWVRSPLTGYSSEPVDVPRPSSADVVRYYHGMLVDAADDCWPNLFANLAAASPEPFMICCHCGKDRTGLTVAAILDLLGSPVEDIARDYGASAPDLVVQVDRFRDKWVRRGHTRDDYLSRMRVTDETMRTWLLEVTERHGGGPVRFLRQRGSAPEQLRLLREELLTP
ncbi:tyrosine-protein phosphatase [Streptomyces sp. NPDC101455]|uniref:tyrosine-protein phosphatase n=1 Tax=Streptomyces sp. NPDC101455 TaxID=3366142 RepID=UPI00380C33C6